MSFQMKINFSKFLIIFFFAFVFNPFPFYLRVPLLIIMGVLLGYWKPEKF